MANRVPFGKESRVSIIKQHLKEAGKITAESAWKFIYEELLWIDGSTGLAHLYESDKAQQGRRWYDRSVIFTDMLCERFGSISTLELKQKIDRLFRACLEKLIQTQNELPEKDDISLALTAAEAASEFPENIVSDASEKSALDKDSYIPDADLVAEFANILIHQIGLKEQQAEKTARHLVAKARFYFTVERKRQNVLGEGFEDLLQLLLINISHISENQIAVRKRANDLPGFQGTTTRERIEAPDIAIIINDRTELIASVKWSLRHDRQKQLSDELDCYVDLLTQDRFPQYVLVTNEYDPGRLVNTDGLARRGQKIDGIYHINLELLQGAIHDHERIKDIIRLIKTGRLQSIESFLSRLKEQFGSKS